jgi:hypothetical protein
MSQHADSSSDDAGVVEVVDASDFLSLSNPSGALSVNAAFAARFDAGAARAASQRKAALVASALVPAHVLRAFTVAISKAAAGGGGSVALPPEQIVADVFARHQLRAAEGAAPAVVAPRSAAAAAELERFLGAGPGRAAVAKLLRWARAAAYKARSEQPPAQVAGGERAAGDAAGGAVSARRRKREDAVDASDAPAGAVAVRKNASLARAAVIKSSTAVAAGQSADFDAKRSRVVAIVAPPPPPPPPVQATAAIRGRGVGRGRGLLDCGEPPFEELHPSWKAKRVREARQQKAVRRDLRADAGAA